MVLYMTNWGLISAPKNQQTGCKLIIKQDATVQTTSMELDIGKYPGRVSSTTIDYGYL